MITRRKPTRLTPEAEMRRVRLAREAALEAHRIYVRWCTQTFTPGRPIAWRYGTQRHRGVVLRVDPDDARRGPLVRVFDGGRWETIRVHQVAELGPRNPELATETRG